MDAYVLNMDSRPDRWEAIQAQFKDATSIRLQRYRAIPHSCGGYGLFLTLIQLLQHAKRTHIPNLLILEDDCLPAPGWEERWATVRQWLDSHPDVWDIYTAGAWGGNATFQTITELVGLEPEKIGKAGDSILFQYPVVTHGGHWLYIPARTYGPLLKRFKQYASLVKFIPYFASDTHFAVFKTISSYPFIAYQASTYSNLEKKFIPRERLLKQYEKKVGRFLTRKRKRTE